MSQLFSGETRSVEETGRTARQSHSGKAADVNRQIRSLVPGQTISGEIVGRSGREIQLRISDDMVLNARVDQGIRLEMGKNLTFEVKNNGSALSLSPLFTNVATDVNVLKALDMAGLPVNETSVAMTEQLMNAGLSVNKSSLQQVYREINSFPEGEISDVVSLHRMQMPVNEANMRQMASYRNLTYQLISGMETVLDAIPEAVNGMLGEGNVQGVAGLYRELFAMVQGELSAETEQLGTGAGENAGGQASVGTETGILGGAGGAESTQEPGSAKIIMAEQAAPGDGTPEALRQAASAEAARGMSPEGAAGRGELAREMLHVLDELQLSSGESGALAEQIQSFGRGELSATELFGAAGRLLEAARHTPEGMQAVQRLFGSRVFNGFLAEQLKEQWTMCPEELQQPGRVGEFYRRLEGQLKGLTQALQEGGQAGGTAFKAATSLSQNIDFLNQINQVYTYVQLPLRLQSSDVHGDLYVYTNKRNLVREDGQVSALLHLDMEHLGPVDVYVALQANKVNTNFYVADDGVLDFIEAHMDILTERLARRGYDCRVSLSARGETEGEEKGGGLEPLLQQGGNVLLSQYAFDVRT